MRNLIMLRTYITSGFRLVYTDYSEDGGGGNALGEDGGGNARGDVWKGWGVAGGGYIFLRDPTHTKHPG